MLERFFKKLDNSIVLWNYKLLQLIKGNGGLDIAMPIESLRKAEKLLLQFD